MFQDYTSYTAMTDGLKFGMRNQHQQNYPDEILSDIRSVLKPNYGQPDALSQGTYDVITFDSYMQPNTDGKFYYLHTGEEGNSRKVSLLGKWAQVGSSLSYN